MVMAAGDNQFKVDAPITVIDLSANVVAGNFAGGNVQYVATAPGNHPKLRVTFIAPDGFIGGAWSTNPAISLWCTKQDVGGAGNDELDPVGTDAKGVRYLRTFKIDDHATIATRQVQQAVISAQDADKLKFFLRNDTGRDIAYVAANIQVIIEPVTNGPKA